MWTPLSRTARNCSRRLSQMRFFAKRRKRLDEYDHYERPLSAKSWKRLRFEGSFFEHSFQDMTPGEVSNSVFVASKMDVQNDAFWTRAALGVADLAGAMTARQLTETCWGFGAAKWHDDALVKALAAPLIKLAPTMKATHLASNAQALARMKVRNVAVLQALSQAAQQSLQAGHLKGKGLAMIAKAFAELEFDCTGFLSALDSWASTGAGTCRLDVSLDLFHSLSLASKPSTSPYPQPIATAPMAAAPSTSAMALAETLALRVKELEAPQLHTCALAMGKLRVDDVNVIRSFQKEVLADLSALHTNSLPPVLESFALCFQSLAAKGKDTSDPEILQERETFLLQVTGRLARELRLLRPQDATRLLQAIDRLGLVEPRLLGMAAQLVPERLAKWKKDELLALLEAYAAAENEDHFMVPCLRRALVPLPQAMDPKHDARSLDDVQIVRAAEAFAALKHISGLVALLTLRTPASTFTASCQLALASLVAHGDAAWNEATRQLVEKAARDAEALEDGNRLMEALSHAIAEHPQWWSAADAKRYPADDILLAILGFPRHRCVALWCDVLATKISESSLALLPALLLRLEGSEAAAALQPAAEMELLRRLASAEAPEMPALAVVATFKVLAKIYGRRSQASQDLSAESLTEVLLRCTDPLLRRLAQEQLPAKVSVRVLQSLQVMGLEPPALLVTSLANRAGSLSPEELIAALRPLTAKSIKLAGGRSLLTAAATRAMGQLKSSRQAWELDGLCKALKLDVGEVIPDEELFKEEVSQAG